MQWNGRAPTAAAIALGAEEWAGQVTVRPPPPPDREERVPARDHDDVGAAEPEKIDDDESAVGRQTACVRQGPGRDLGRRRQGVQVSQVEVRCRQPGRREAGRLPVEAGGGVVCDSSSHVRREGANGSGSQRTRVGSCFNQAAAVRAGGGGSAMPSWYSRQAGQTHTTACRGRALSGMARRPWR